MDALYDFLYELDSDYVKVNQYQLDAKERKRIRDSIRGVFHCYARSILNFKNYMVTMACNKDPALERVVSDLPQLISGMLGPALDRFLRKIGLGRQHYGPYKTDSDGKSFEQISSSTFSDSLGKRPEQTTAPVTKAPEVDRPVEVIPSTSSFWLPSNG